MGKDCPKGLFCKGKGAKNSTEGEGGGEILGHLNFPKKTFINELENLSDVELVKIYSM